MFETCNAIFRQGHFYDTITHKRIELNEDTRVCLVAERGGFSERKIVGHRPNYYRTSEEILSAVQQLDSLPRKAIAEASVRSNGFVLIVQSRAGLIAVANRSGLPVNGSRR